MIRPTEKSSAQDRKEVPGLLAFASLRAEEEPWLEECFVPPPDFEHMAAPNRSVVIFGERGSGKTAVYRILHTYSTDSQGKPGRLMVDWRPSPLSPETRPELTRVRRLVGEILDTCASALVHHLARFPDNYTVAPHWAQVRLAWFIQRFTLGTPEIRWGPIAESDQPGAPLLRRILTTPVPDVLHPDAPLEQVIAELRGTVRAMGLEEIWVLTDGLENWLEMAAEHLTTSLKAFLSTLSLFGPSSLVYKFCLPAELEGPMSRAGGVMRRRIASIRLRWDSLTLRRLVERRLAVAFGREAFTLEELCSTPALLEWLEKTGGISPREWLDQIAVLAEYHAAHPQNTPIDRETWLRLRRSRPPRLYLDEEKGRIVVGGRQISLEGLPTKAYEMLCYLYRRGGEVVSREELYFKIYRGLDYVPSPADDHYEPFAFYRGVVDTNLWRLREAIEPDPKHPVLLLTRRGHGVTLQVRW